MAKTVMCICFLILLLSAHAWGEIVISNNYLPAPGTVITYSYDANMDSAYYSSLTDGIAGPKSWDFTSRVFSPGYTQLSVNLATTPSIDSFPGANLSFLMVAGPDSIWTTSRSQSDVFRSLGMVHHSILGNSLVIYKNTAPEFVFPISFANQWTSYRHWSQAAGTFRNEISDTTRYTADAWGTARYGSTSVPCVRITARETSYIKMYNSSNVLIDSTKTDIFAAYFIAEGFDLFVSACKSISGGDTTYSLTASDDFLKSPTDVASETEALPSDFALSQNYPNPFNPTTTIQYTLPTRSAVRIEVYNTVGQMVRLLVDGEKPAGNHTVTWDGKSSSGNPVSTGVYLYRLRAGNVAKTKSMLLLK